LSHRTVRAHDGHMRVPRSAALLAAVATLLAMAPAPASSAPSARRAIHGSTPAWARASRDVGRTRHSAAVDFAVYLPLRDKAAAEALARQVSTPGGASYRKFLSPAQVQQSFAPTSADVGAVKDFLRDAGFTVTAVAPNNAYVRASGTVAQANAAFGTDIHNYRYLGRTLAAPSRELTVPAAVADQVLAVVGLDQSLNRPAARGGPQPAPPPAAFVNAPPCSTYFGEKIADGMPPVQGQLVPYVPCGYTPAQFRGAYGTSATGRTGSGVTVAIVDAYAAPTILQDANQYATSHGDAAFSSGQLTQITPRRFRYGYNSNDLCGEQGWYGEETLDVEAVHAMAPAANVRYVAAASCLDSDLLQALNTIIAGDLADVITNSWGSLGEDEPRRTLSAYHNLFLQAALEGITVNFSSGDDGDDSGATADGSPAVDFPASEPLVTAVGGTSLGVNADNSYGFETGWSTGTSTLTDGAWTPPYPGDWLYGGGGGTSALFGQPAYQQGIVPPTGARMLPDVSMDGDPQTGMLIGETQRFPDGTDRYSEFRLGGTSLASPLFAGLEALVVQGTGRLGQANPWLYSRAAGAYRDVSGPAPVPAVVRVNFNNSVDASDGTTTLLRSLDDEAQSLHVTPGWDNLTGLGSPNGATFVGAG
jgi:subtilase family serine protease